MKLELKHLAVALANNQKVLFFDKERESNKICDIRELTKDELLISDGEYDYYLTSFDEIKLILKPLSDLTKEITHDGKTFVPIERIKTLTDENHFEYIERFIYDTETIEIIPYWVIELLFEWHLDVFGLIEQGLAVDINTLNND